MRVIHRVEAVSNGWSATLTLSDGGTQTPLVTTANVFPVLLTELARLSDFPAYFPPERVRPVSPSMIAGLSPNCFAAASTLSHTESCGNSMSGDGLRKIIARPLVSTG